MKLTALLATDYKTFCFLSCWRFRINFPELLSSSSLGKDALFPGPFPARIYYEALRISLGEFHPSFIIRTSLDPASH